MSDLGPDGNPTAFVLGKSGDESRYRSLVEAYALEATVYGSHDAFLAAPDEERTSHAYLVLEAGAADREILSVAREGNVDVLFVADDPGRAKAAMTAGADVFLAASNLDNLEHRFESLHVGSVVDALPGSDAGVAGNVQRRAYETFMRTFEDLIYVFDRHGRFLRVNRAKATALGSEPNAFVGESDFTHFEADIAAEVYRDTLEVAEGLRTVENKTEWIVDSDGNFHHVTATKHPIEDEDGVVIGVVGISRYITDLTREKVLVERTKSLVEHLYDTFDHNFRNRSQAQLGVTALTESQHVTGRVERTLDTLEGILDEMEAVLSDAEDGTVVANGAREADADRSLRDLEAEMRELCATANSALANVVDSIAEAEHRTQRKVDGMDRLIADFRELVSVVNTAGESATIDVGEMARTIVDRPVDAEPDLLVKADGYKLGTFFEQLNDELREPGEVRIGRTDAGFRIDVPDRVEIPEMGDRFRTRHLDDESKGKLKLRLVVESLGWDVESRHSAAGDTSLHFDVDAWKRDLVEE